MIDESWVSVTKTRNYLLRDPLLDWLNLYGEAAGYQRDDQYPQYDPRTNFTKFLFRKGKEFEQAVVRYLLKLAEVRTISTAAADVRSPEAAKATVEAMHDGIEIVYQGVLHNTEVRTYGAPDLLIRSDVLERLFPNVFAKEPKNAAKQPAPNLGVDWHYRVVDVKYTTLHLLKSGSLSNCGSGRAYKAQLYCYNEMLGRVLGYQPPTAFLLGRGWQQRGDRGNSCMERLAAVHHNEFLNSTSLAVVTQRAVDWIRQVRLEGAEWSPTGESVPPELRPNLGNQEDSPWHYAKRVIAKKTGELTQLWMVGPDKRDAANADGITSWTDPRCTPEAVHVTGVKQQPVLQALLDVNRDSDSPPVQPAVVKADEAFWRPERPLEFYVDFETVSDLDDDFSRIPDRGGQPLIFMIGCGHLEAGEWNFSCFVVEEMSELEEARIIDAWIDHMAAVKRQLDLEGDEPFVFHWSPAEVSTLETAYNSAVARHPEKDWPEPLWYDFLGRVVKAEPVVVRGALGFGLKAVGKALHELGCIDTLWGLGPTDGLGAMVGAWWAAHQYGKFSENGLVQEIRQYNEVDCRVMMEVVRYLRSA